MLKKTLGIRGVGRVHVVDQDVFVDEAIDFRHQLLVDDVRRLRRARGAFRGVLERDVICGERDVIVHVSVYVFVPVGREGSVSVVWRVVLVGDITCVIIALRMVSQVLGEFVQFFRLCDFVQNTFICVGIHVHRLGHTVVQPGWLDGRRRLRAVVESVVVLKRFWFC